METLSKIDYSSVVASRVNNGAQWLDDRELKWIDKIDLDTLEMSSPVSCVLGQVFNFQSGADYLDFLDHTFMNDDLTVILGFDTISSDLITHNELQTAWIELVTNRRNG